MSKLATGTLIGIAVTMLAQLLMNPGTALEAQADPPQDRIRSNEPYDVEVRLQERYLSDLARDGLQQTELGAPLREIRVDAAPRDRLLVSAGFPVLGVSLPVWLVLSPKVEHGDVVLRVRSLQVAGFVFPSTAFAEVEQALNGQVEESIGSMAGEMEAVSATTDQKQLIVRFARVEREPAAGR